MATDVDANVGEPDGIDGIESRGYPQVLFELAGSVGCRERDDLGAFLTSLFDHEERVTVAGVLGVSDRKSALAASRCRFGVPLRLPGGQ